MDLIDAALLPPLWAIVRDYFYPAELVMMHQLGLALTNGVTVPTELNMNHVIRNGQFNVVQWAALALSLTLATGDVKRSTEWVVETSPHPIAKQFRPAGEALNLCLRLAATHNWAEMLRWMVNTWTPAKIPIECVAEFMDMDTLRWAVERTSDPVTRGMALAARRSKVDPALKRAWAEEHTELRWKEEYTRRRARLARPHG